MKMFIKNSSILISRIHLVNTTVICIAKYVTVKKA